MENIRLVIFDLAGTTIEDSGQVVDAFNTILDAIGFHLSLEQLQSFRGASKREAIRSFVGDERTDQIYDSFRKHLAGIYAQNGVKEIPGAQKTFQWLRDHDIRIALNTGFDRWLTELILQSVAWDQVLISTVVCGDDVRQGRPAPDLIHLAMERNALSDPDQVANIGDTSLDLQAAANAGVHWNIGVLSGAHNEEHLRKFPHTHLLRSVANLPELWD